MDVLHAKVPMYQIGIQIDLTEARKTNAYCAGGFL